MIVVVGSLNMDLVIRTARIPRPGETVLGSDLQQIPGGKGGNQADAAAKLGAKVRMIGAVGSDDFGQALTESLRIDGVETDLILRKDRVATGVAAIVVEESGNNAITVAPGADFSLEPEDLKAQKDVIKQADLLLVQLENRLDTVEAALRIAKESGVTTILNPAPATALPAALLPSVDLLTPNETELEVLTGMPTSTPEQVQQAGLTLIRQGVRELIVTLGEKGCCRITADLFDRYEAYPVTAIDTTAAGDSFNGALAVALSEGKSREDAIRFAMAVGALTVTKKGAQSSLPLRSEVDAFLKEVLSR